jgi:chemotaxis protein CheD
MTVERVVWVNIGDVKTTSTGQTLKTNLGSCVGIGLLWGQRRLYGLAHCLLPAAPPQQTVRTGKYVDHALALLVEEMAITRSKTAEVQAIVCGGASIVKFQSAIKHWTIGVDNVAAALKHLAEMKISILYQDTGDHYARQMTLHCEQGTYSSQRIDANKLAER